MAVLTNILEAKESRALLRKQIAETNKASVSLNLNIAGWPKSNDMIHKAFMEILSDFQDFLLAHRVIISDKESHNFVDAAGNFFIAPIESSTFSLEELKALFESFEGSHFVGRLVDVDLTSGEGEPISSGKLKKCLVCKGRAIDCMRLKKHSFEEIKEITNNIFSEFLNSVSKKKICERFAAIAVQSLILEVSLSPKPGLVDFYDNGIHTDMDYLSFIQSSTVLQEGFRKIIQLALDAPANIESELPKLRIIGIEMEREMLNATLNVNTQKGAIFLMGILLYCYTLAYLQGNTSDESIRLLTSSLCKQLIDDDMNNKGIQSNSLLTHGLSCFNKYGHSAGGARYEAAMGFPIVFQHGLPELQQLKYSSLERIPYTELCHAMHKSLSRIMSVSSDTNILYRSSLEVLKGFNQLALKLYNTSKPEEETAYRKQLTDYCTKHKISAGGSADMLACSLLIFLLNRETKKDDL
ncbi:MAG: triphosphoribosyl-dephospho-CoA synthase [Hyphomicrobiales bacterium]